jgi:phage baseplate assembly protein W
MFLERKFLTPTERSAANAPGAANDADRPSGLPEPLGDVVRNIERVLATERGIGHVLPDFGLSRSGQGSVEGVLAHATAELRETLPRYEARFAIDELETDVDDDGRPFVHVLGRIAGARVTLTIDPLRRRVHAVQLG